MESDYSNDSDLVQEYDIPHNLGGDIRPYQFEPIAQQDSDESEESSDEEFDEDDDDDEGVRLDCLLNPQQ